MPEEGPKGLNSWRVENFGAKHPRRPSSEANNGKNCRELSQAFAGVRGSWHFLTIIVNVGLLNLWSSAGPNSLYTAKSIEIELLFAIINGWIWSCINARQWWWWWFAGRSLPVVSKPLDLPPSDRVPGPALHGVTFNYNGQLVLASAEMWLLIWSTDAGQLVRPPVHSRRTRREH